MIDTERWQCFLCNCIFCHNTVDKSFCPVFPLQDFLPQSAAKLWTSLCSASSTDHGYFDFVGFHSVANETFYYLQETYNESSSIFSVKSTLVALHIHHDGEYDHSIERISCHHVVGQNFNDDCDDDNRMRMMHAVMMMIDINNNDMIVVYYYYD